MLHRAARNAYSWWWASHIRTKQSKWLDQNLQDMEEKVEYMLKIVNEDGDSFAQRAEMYYRKRPEIVNFVEDSFRGYRALAERYDHLSKELQNANRTIASVYPEQIQLALDEEDEENLPTTSNSSGDPTMPSKNLPAVPKLDIPKTMKIPQKRSKSPTRLMSKKGLIKMNEPTTVPAKTSGMSKDEALEEIDRLQKNILGLQTEKEFVKSSYESGLSKYWEIEEQVTELQAKVNNLQDEFSISSFIEDDEARTLMAATALKSCQETLIQLQEKQQQSDEEARVECQRIKEAHEKLEMLKDNFGNHTNGEDLTENPKFFSTSMEKVDSMEQEGQDLELLKAKIKEQLQVNSSESLTMSELAEKIDDLVEKVIILESAVSSKNSLVKRLKSETNELQTHLQSLEEDNEALTEGSDSKSNKIRELELELLRIQNLNQNVNQQDRNLQIHFTEASFSVDHLSEKLQTVKQDEEVDYIATFKESRAFSVALEKEFQVREGLAFPEKKPKTPKLFAIMENVIERKKGKKDGIIANYSSVSAKAEDDNLVQSNPSSHVDDLLVPVEVGDNDSVLSVNARMEEEAKKDEVPDQSSSIEAEEIFIQSDLGNCLDVLSIKGQEISIPGDNLLSEGLNEHKDVMVPERQTSFQFNPFVCLEDFSVNGQVSAVSATTSEAFEEGEDIMASKISPDVKTEEGEKKDDNQDLTVAVKAEEENIVQTSPSNHFDDLPMKDQVRVAQDASEKMFQEHEGVMGPGNDSMISKDANRKKDETKDNVPDDSKPQMVEADHKVESQELETEDEDQPDWRQMFMNGLDDTEKILLQQYTSILRNYKETKKKLSEAEKKNQDSLFKSAMQIKELKNANAQKDAKIESLHKKLDLLQVCLDEAPDTSLPDFSHSHTRESPKSNQNQVSSLLNEEKVDSPERKEESTAEELVMTSPRKDEQGEKRVISADELLVISTVEGKIRSDIDGLLEENIEFWLRFSSSFHQIHKFETLVQDLQEELTKVKESSKNQGGSRHYRPLNSDVRPIYTHLREIQTELALWLEHNALLEDDLQNRLSSLSSIHEEILRLSNAESKEEETELSDYEAAKFQGEVLNMKQENNKIGYKLQVGLQRVKELQILIAKKLLELEEELGISSKTKNSSSRSRIPLRSFLFGVRLRKQKQALFQCMSPALQKQYSDLHTLPP